MRGNSPADENVVTAQQYFPNDVAFVAIIFEIVFDAKIVQAIDPLFAMKLFTDTVVLNHTIPFIDEFNADIPAGLYGKFIFSFCQVLHDIHNRGFAAADRAC